MIIPNFDKYSRFTDSVVESILFNLADKKLRAQIVMFSKFEKFKVKLTFENVSDFCIPKINVFMNWETEIEQIDNQIKIDFLGVASNWGELWFVCDNCIVEELEGFEKDIKS